MLHGQGKHGATLVTALAVDSTSQLLAAGQVQCHEASSLGAADAGGEQPDFALYRRTASPDERPSEHRVQLHLQPKVGKLQEDLIKRGAQGQDPTILQ